MVNRLGQLKGDMPRYLLWNVKARRMRGSEKNWLRSLSTLANGRSKGRSLAIGRRMTSLRPLKGDSSTGWKASSLQRLSSR